MKATGEVMAIERNFGAALNKALRGLEQGGAGWLAEHPDWTSDLAQLTDFPSNPAISRTESTSDGHLQSNPAQAPEVTGETALSGQPSRYLADLTESLRRFLAPSDSRLWRVIALLRRGVVGDLIQRVTGIAPWFVAELERLILLEGRLRAAGRGMDDELLVGAKRAGFGDRDICTLTGISVEHLRARRDRMGLHPGFAMVDTSAAEFAAETPYFYSTYAAAGSPVEAAPVARPASLVIGSGPVRIGQGIEFDYCAVQASDALRRLGHSSIMVNSNPETVSTDFDASTRLYFESLDAESVAEVLRAETVDGAPPDAFIQFGGQTPLGLAPAVAAARAPLRGLDLGARGQT